MAMLVVHHQIPPRSPLIFEVELVDYRKIDLIKTGTNYL